MNERSVSPPCQKQILCQGTLSFDPNNNFQNETAKILIEASSPDQKLESNEKSNFTCPHMVEYDPAEAGGDNPKIL